MAPPITLKGGAPFPPPKPPAVGGVNVAGNSAPPIVLPRKSSKLPLVVLAAVVVLGGGYFGWKYFMAAKPEKAEAAPTPTVKSSPPPAVVAQPDTAPTPSDTLNKLAHAPANAINKAQGAIETRRASGQARIDAASIGEDLPDRPAATAAAADPAAKSAATPTATTTTSVAPNVTATTAVVAAPEASAPFRSYVANAKVSGVFQGTPARVVINGKLTRAGDVVDPGLGIVFDGIDSGRRHLVFKDQSGATVSRRF
jgi:cytoskeletal protein RodZ